MTACVVRPWSLWRFCVVVANKLIQEFTKQRKTPKDWGSKVSLVPQGFTIL